jgi:hypothetical protein
MSSDEPAGNLVATSEVSGGILFYLAVSDPPETEADFTEITIEN